MMANWMQEPMEPIPEEGEEWPVAHCNARNKTTRKREIYTSEQVDTLVSTVPRDTVPEDWVVENEVVDPQMATSYMTEALAGPNSARGTSYSYTYESHYDNPPEEEEIVSSTTAIDEGNVHQTHKVTRVTKVTTTRSVRQIPVGSPYGDLYFDSSGLPTPSPVVEIENAVEELGISLRDQMEDRAAPPPAPPLGSRYGNISDEYSLPEAPGVPDVLELGIGEVTICWGAPLRRPGEKAVIGYQIEMRDLPDGEWERAHDQLLTDTTCTITNLESLGDIQFRVSAASRDGFGPPSTASLPVRVPMGYGQSASNDIATPPAPGKPSVVAVDGHRATLQWAPPVVDPNSAPVAGYQVEYRTYGSVDWMIANDVLIQETIFTIDDLRPNGVYEFRIKAKNIDGFSVPSKSSGAIHIKPAAPQRGAGSRPIARDISTPGQPQLVEADNDWVKLEWSESQEGVGYVVEFREVGDPNWYTANPHPISQNCIQVEGLRPGSTYEFRVFSVIGASASEPSEISDIISLRPLWKSSASRELPPERPQAPEYLEVQGDRITICWLPAHSVLPVYGYDVEFRDFQQDVGWYKVNDQPVNACKMTVGDLIVGHDYQFRLIAHNERGCSEPSEPSNPVTIQPSNGDAKYVEAERFGAVKLLQEEMVRESPPLPERDDSPPPLRRMGNQNNGTLQWRDPSLKEVIDYLDSHDSKKQLNASGYLQHLTFSDNLIKEETRDYGGIPKLIKLLRHEMPAINRNACACLKNLSFGKENDKNKLAILDADGVRLLSALLQTTHDQTVKEECTAALWNLSSADMLKPAILNAATDALVQQVVVPGIVFQSNGLINGAGDPKHYSSPTFKNATGVLRNISAASAAARRQLRACPNLIEGLVHFLTVAIQRTQVDSPAVENVVCILRNLSYRIQEVEDPNYDPSTAHLHPGKPSKSAPNSPKPKKKDKDKKKKDNKELVQGAAVLWQAHVVKLYLKLLQEASNMETLEASAGAIQNLAACQFNPSVEVRAAVRVEKGLPILVELVRLTEDYVVCAVATALRNLSLDARNRELIGKFALRDLVDKLPEPGKPRLAPDPAIRGQSRECPISDQTIGAILGILFEVVRHSATFTKDLHECRGTEKLRTLARSYPIYSQRVCRYASQVLYMMWQHKELHDGFKRSGLKEADFYSGPARRGDSSTLARPISSQGRERPAQALLDETTSSGGYGAVGETQHSRPLPPQRNGSGLQRIDRQPPPAPRQEPLYASVNKGAKGVDDSWV